MCDNNANILELTKLELTPIDRLDGGYERVVGVNYRNISYKDVAQVAPAVDSSAGIGSLLYPAFPFFQQDAELLLAISNGTETKIEGVLVDLSRGRIKERRTLIRLSKCRNIVHATLSARDKYGHSYLAYTEVTREETALPCYKIWLHLLGTNIFSELSSSTSLSFCLPAHMQGYKIRNLYQVCYFVRPKEEGDPLYVLIVCDYVIIELSEIKTIKQRPRIVVKNTFQIGRNHLWHQWDPIRQRIAFWAYRSNEQYKFRIVQLLGGKDACRVIFDMNVKWSYQPVGPPPFPVLPMTTWNGSLNAKYVQTMIPIIYEDGTEDIALCHQRLEVLDGSTGYHRLLYSIRLLHNMLHEVRIAVDVEPDELPAIKMNQARATFVFVDGLIVVFLSGIFVHFVDVAHSDQLPKYLFGINLLKKSSEPFAAYIPEPLSKISNTSFSVVPNGHADWIVGTCGTTLHRIHLSRGGLWRWMRDALYSGSFFEISNVLHLATTHLPPDREVAMENLLDLAIQQHELLSPYVMLQILLGDAYNAARERGRASDCVHWCLLPMMDDKCNEEMEHLLRFQKDTRVVSLQHAPIKEFILEMCNNTPSEWWIQPSKSFLWLRRDKGATKSQSHTRLNLADCTRTGRLSYAGSLFTLLKGKAVPKEAAQRISHTYSCYIEDVISILQNSHLPNLPPRHQLHYLHTLKVTLLALGYPESDDLRDRYSRLALAFSPPRIVIGAIQSRLYSPDIELLFQFYQPLQEAANDAARDFGISNLPLRSLILHPKDKDSGGLPDDHSKGSVWAGFRPRGTFLIRERVMAPHPSDDTLEDSYSPDGASPLDCDAVIRHLLVTCTDLIHPSEFSLMITSDTLLASPSVSNAKKLSFITAIDPEPLLQSHRCYCPLEPFGDYHPLSLFLKSAFPSSPIRETDRRWSSNFSFKKTPASSTKPIAFPGEQERAKELVSDSLYPLLSQKDGRL